MSTRLVFVLAMLGACDRGRVEEPTPSDPPSAPTTTEPPAPEVPADRRCGEAGREPTALPPTLAKGMTVIGEATVAPGEQKTIGTVSLTYSESAWIGPRGSGHRGLAVDVMIEQAEANGGPWGRQIEISPKHTETFDLGPYHIAASIAEGERPTLTAVVRKNECPKQSDIARTDEPRSFWVSTEAIAAQVFDTQGDAVIVAMVERPDGATLEVSALAWRQPLAVQKAKGKRIRVNRRVVTIDEVVVDGDKAHARVRIEPAPAPDEATPIAATKCGDASPVRTELPAELAAGVLVVDDLHLSPGEKAKTGGLELALTESVAPAPNDLELRIAGPLPTYVALSLGETRFAELGSETLRVDADKDGEVRVRRLRLPCDPVLAMPDVKAPIAVWLSTAGHGTVTLGPQRLTMRLVPAASEAYVSMDSEGAYFSRALTPATAGEAYSLADWVVEIVDVVASGGTRFEDQRWVTAGALPIVHVQVRVSPST